MAAKIFLTLVGLMYAALSIWCSVAPKTTSQKVGFDLHPGNGESEYFVIYGGWELAMAIVFILPWFRTDMLEFSLLTCVIMHACLVLFRTASFSMFSGIQGLTYNLAIGEWVIFLASLAIYWMLPKS